MNIGVMAGSNDPAQLRRQLEAASAAGYTAVQLTPTPASDASSLQADLDRLGLQVVALGGYVNPLRPDPDAIDSALRHAIEQAPAFGCPIVVTWSGTASSSLFEDHLDNTSALAWQKVVAFFREVALWAEASGVTVAIEPFHNHVASTPQRLRDLLDDIGSPRIAAVMDPPNFIKPDQIDAANDLLPAMFDALEGRIAIAHAKDLRHPQPGETDRVLAGVALPGPGEGMLDYTRYGQLLTAHGIDTLVVEHLASPAAMQPALSFVTAHLN